MSLPERETDKFVKPSPRLPQPESTLRSPRGGADMGTKRCPQCGVTIPENSNFCSNCGGFAGPTKKEVVMEGEVKYYE